jgi:hypothetical protein
MINLFDDVPKNGHRNDWKKQRQQIDQYYFVDKKGRWGGQGRHHLSFRKTAIRRASPSPIVLSSRDIAAAWGKATHVVAIFSTDAHAFTEGKDDKISKHSENGKTDKPMRNGHASLLAPHLADSIPVRAAIIITVKSDR